jgi:hypothetical protein
MFDRYPGDNDTKLEPWQKLYLAGREGRTVCLPSANIMSGLSAQNTDSWPKRLLDSRKYKAFCFAAGGCVTIDPKVIPLTRDGSPIVFGKISGKNEDGWECDPQSGIYIHRATARLEKGVPNPKVRPTCPLPWEMEFTLKLYANKHIQEQQLLNVMTEGLLFLGLGTWRGQYGKAEIVLWE